MPQDQPVVGGGVGSSKFLVDRASSSRLQSCFPDLLQGPFPLAAPATSDGRFYPGTQQWVTVIHTVSMWICGVLFSNVSD